MPQFRLCRNNKVIKRLHYPLEVMLASISQGARALLPIYVGILTPTQSATMGRSATMPHGFSGAKKVRRNFRLFGRRPNQENGWYGTASGCDTVPNLMRFLRPPLTYEGTWAELFMIYFR